MKIILKILFNAIKFVLNSYRFVIYFLSGFVPRKKEFMVFGSWEGKKYCDNAKYLFLYIIKNHPEFKPVWLSKNKKIIEKIKKDGCQAYDINSWQGFWFSCRAKYIFITHGLPDVNPYATRNAVIIDLFHATCPIKKMGYDDFNSYPLTQKVLAYLSSPFEFIKRDYAFSPSENISNVILNSALGIKKENIIVTGLPRTDFILSENSNDDEVEFKNIFGEKKYSKLIYYIPTFRNRKEFNLYNFNYDEKRLNGFLEKYNSIFLIRFHPFDAFKYKDIAKGTGRILFDTSDDLYPILKKADVLITDYSSVGFDFVLLDKPIIFANFDHENYMKERSFYHEYEKITPGPKVKDWQELVNVLEKSVDSRNDQYRDEREKMRKYIYQYMDINASERIISFIKSL